MLEPTADNMNAALVLAMLEQAKRPEREFDGLLHDLIFPCDPQHLITCWVGVAGKRNYYSEHLEAAIMLVETWLVGREDELGEEWEWRVHRNSAGSFSGVVWCPDDINHEYFGAHAFPSMALLIALLKAASSVNNRPTPEAPQKDSA